MADKRYLDKDVYTAAVERINTVFDHFDRVCVSFSGGKDSTVLLHLTLEIARQRGRLPVDVLFIDLEGQYSATIDHVRDMMSLPEVRPWWIALPLNLRNAVSAYEPHWCCWDPDRVNDWVRPLPEAPGVISAPSVFPFYRFRMEFEEFVPAFQDWLAGDGTMAAMVGIRADESLNRYRAITKDRESRFMGLPWTRCYSERVTSCYPIYDWRVEDDWTYIGQNGLPYNRLYDQMRLAGKSIHEMRICQPYGDNQRKGLDQYHLIEPDTWARVVQRVGGANYGAIYASQRMLGYQRGLGLPTGHTWESYTHLLLDTLPEASRQHYLRKFSELGAAQKHPPWRRMALCILKNDLGCRSLAAPMSKDLYDTSHQPPDESPRPTSNLEAVKRKYADL